MRKKTWGKNTDTGKLRDPADVPSVAVVPSGAVTDHAFKELDKLLAPYGLEVVRWTGTPGDTFGFSIEGRRDVGSAKAERPQDEA